MLRSFANQAAKAPDPLGFINQPLPVYIEGYGFVPPSQVLYHSHSCSQSALPSLLVVRQELTYTPSYWPASTVSEPSGRLPSPALLIGHNAVREFWCRACNAAG